MIASDITSHKDSEDKLRESRERFRFLSFNDPVTGLYNRTYFETELDRLNRDLKRSHPLTIFKMELSDLRKLEQEKDKDIANKVLKAASKIFTRSFRIVDIVARVTGTSFSAILPNVDQEVAQKIKNRMLSQINLHREKYPEIPMKILIGIATTQKPEKESIYDIYRDAQSNYQGKTNANI